MYDVLFDFITKKKRAEPYWYVLFRVFVALGCLAGVAVYAVITLINVLRKDTFIVESQSFFGDVEFNGTAPFPGMFIFILISHLFSLLCFCFFFFL